MSRRYAAGICLRRATPSFKRSASLCAFAVRAEIPNECPTSSFEHPAAMSETTAGVEADLEYRYCTECVVIGNRVDRRHLREELSAIGGSLVVAGLQHKVRVHIHVNDPAEVFRIAGRFGTVSGEKADDMQRQQHAAHVVGRKVAVVTDSGADIPEDEMDRLDIHMVPLRVHFGDKGYLSGARLMAGAEPELAAAPPRAFFKPLG